MKNASKKAYSLLSLCETFTQDQVAAMTDALEQISGPIPSTFVDSVCSEATPEGALRPVAEYLIEAVRNYAAFDRLLAEYDTPPSEEAAMEFLR